MRRALAIVLLAIAGGIMAVGCESSWKQPLEPGRANLRPSTQPATASVGLDPSLVRPMHRELMAIDLPAVARLVEARNLDILSARQRVEASHGDYAATIGNALPVAVMKADVVWHRGSDRAVQGNIVGANYFSVHPAAAVEWMVNPGQVVYDILASRKRLRAAQQDEVSVRMLSLQQAANQYYDLCLWQARVEAALEARRRAEESLRVGSQRLMRGTVVPAEEMRSRAELASRQQDVLLAVYQFYIASIALADTLQLDPAVTLVPKPAQLEQLTLVREELTVEELMAIAVENRPDLKRVRELAAAVEADKSSTFWRGLGSTLGASYEVAGIGSRAEGNSPTPATGTDADDKPPANRGPTFKMRPEQRAAGDVRWRISPSIIGYLETADANERLGKLDVQRQLQQLRSEVMRAIQSRDTHAKLVPIARQQLDAGREALRRDQGRLRVGQAILLEVLDAQDVVAQAMVRYAEAVVGYNQAQVNLMAAAGLLYPVSLAAD